MKDKKTFKQKINWDYTSACDECRNWEKVRLQCKPKCLLYARGTRKCLNYGK